MNASEAVTIAETFLRDHIARRYPAVDTTSPEDFAIVVQRVEVEGELGLRVTFGIGMPFRIGDHRAPERINACLTSLLEAHPELATFRIEVTADEIDAPAGC